MKLGILASLAVALLGTGRDGHAQVTTQRRAPAGFETAGAATSERSLYLSGEAQPGIVLIAGTAGPNTLLLAPASTVALAALLASQGVHERAARIWAQSADFTLGRTTCLPAARSAGCLPVKLEAQGSRVELKLSPKREQAEEAEGVVSSLGSVYASGGFARVASGRQTLSAGVATRGMLTLRDTYFEYDVQMTGQGDTDTSTGRLSLPKLAPSYNLLVASTPLPGGARAFAGSYRAAGLGSQGAANEFFVRPRMLGVAAQTDNEPLQAGSSSQVRVTLLAPARITLYAGNVQVYSALHGVGEQVITFEARTGNFVDLVTQDMSGRQERFQAAVHGIGGTGGAPPPSWRLEAGRTAAGNGTAARDTHVPKTIFTLLRRTQFLGYAVQGGLQAVPGSVLRGGISTGSGLGSGSATEASRALWGGALMLGTGGELGASGFGAGQVAGFINVRANASRYRPPVARAGARDACSAEGGSLCYSNRTYSSASINLGLWDWPVQLGVSAFTGLKGTSRQILLQGSSRLPFGNANARVLWGLRRSDTGTALFAFLVYPLGDGSTLLTTSLSGSAGGGPLDAAASYSHNFEDDGGWLESISQSVQAGGASPLSFHHQLTGHSGSTAANLSGSHSARSMDVQGSIYANYGVSRSGVAFARHEPGLGLNSFAPSSSAALKVVNDSLDDQIVVLGWRNIDVPAQSTVLIPVDIGYAPEFSISPGPVAQSERAAMPDYLFAGNVKEIHIERGNWYHVKFVAADAAGQATGGWLRATHTRSVHSGDEQRIYQDSQGFSFIFEPAGGSALIRYITSTAGMAPVTHRCEAAIPPTPAQRDVYQQLIYRCRIESAPGAQ